MSIFGTRRLSYLKNGQMCPKQYFTVFSESTAAFEKIVE